MRYRIYTENKKIEVLQSIVGEYFDSYTVFAGQGVYKGSKELSAVFEIVTDAPGALSFIKYIADAFKAENNQTCVLVTREAVEAFTF